jgi:hypothetical protein
MPFPISHNRGTITDIIRLSIVISAVQAVVDDMRKSLESGCSPSMEEDSSTLGELSRARTSFLEAGKEP